MLCSVLFQCSVPNLAIQEWTRFETSCLLLVEWEWESSRELTMAIDYGSVFSDPLSESL